MEAWALDDLMINDGSDRNSDWLSLIRDGRGLPRVDLVGAERQGRWPIVSDVRRPGRFLGLETWFGHADPEEAIKLYHQYLNPELQTVRRLLAADHVYPSCAPDNVLLSLASWHLSRDLDTWTVTDLLEQVTGTLAGGWRVWPGEGLQFAEATTNMVLNPVAGAAGNFAALGAATVTRSTSYRYVGQGDYAYSYKVVATAAANDGMSLTLSALSNNIHTFTIRLLGDFPTLRWSLDNLTWNEPALLGTDVGDDGETWSVYGFAFPAAQANGSTTFYLKQTDAVARTYYVDGGQGEQKPYPTPLCTGDMGPGHSWSGTEHASTSSRTKTELSFARTMPAAWTVLAWGAVVTADWAVSSSYPRLWQWGSATDKCTVFNDQSNDRLRLVWINSGGTNYNDGITSTDPTAHTFIFVAVTFDGTTLKAYFNPLTSTPAVTRVPDALLAVNPTTFYVAQNELGNYQWNGFLDDLGVLSRALPGSEVLRLYQQGRAWRPRWVDVLCEYSGLMQIRGRKVWRAREADLMVDGDVRWRGRDGHVHIWRIWDAEEETTLVNSGDDDAYPILYITPKVAKSSDYAYCRWCPFVYNGPYGATARPSMIGPLDTATLIGAGKMQADGDDLRVIIDGVEEPNRWFGLGTHGINQASTDVWVNLDWSQHASAQLGVAIGAGDTVESIEASTGIEAFPSAGILLIDDEAFLYTGKNDALKRFTGVTRAAKGTSAADHTTSDTIYWVEHDIWLLYGNPGVSAPDADDAYKPMVIDAAMGPTMISSNEAWYYSRFGDDDNLRTGAWAYEGDAEGKYTAGHVADADPWERLGIATSQGAPLVVWGRWKLYSPVPIEQVTWNTPGSFGEKWASDVTKWLARLEDSGDGATWHSVWSVPAPALPSNWETWDSGGPVSTDGLFVGIYCKNTSGGAAADNYVEVRSLLVEFDTDWTPVVSIGPEQGNYSLDCVITNETTGDAIRLTLNMALDQVLEVDTDAKLVTLLDDGSSQLQARTLEGGARRDWLRLVPGENVLTFEDADAQGVEIEILWDRRDIE